MPTGWADDILDSTLEVLPGGDDPGGGGGGGDQAPDARPTEETSLA
jgi:hypothetical protein